jgi:hypothetical protein
MIGGYIVLVTEHVPAHQIFNMFERTDKEFSDAVGRP